MHLTVNIHLITRVYSIVQSFGKPILYSLIMLVRELWQFLFYECLQKGKGRKFNWTVNALYNI